MRINLMFELKFFSTIQKSIKIVLYSFLYYFLVAPQVNRQVTTADETPNNLKITNH